MNLERDRRRDDGQASLLGNARKLPRLMRRGYLSSCSSSLALHVSWSFSNERSGPVFGDRGSYTY